MKKVIVDKNELYKLYIEDNLSITEVSNIMNISYRTIQRAIKEFGYNKDRNQIQEQRKELLKEKYGVENTYQLDSSIEKIKQTKLEKYGDKNFNNNKQQKQTMIDKYGVECGYNLLKVQDKIREKFGGMGYASNVIQEKIRQTNLDKYGVEYPIQNKDISSKANSKMKRTLQEKYGVTHNWSIPEVRERTKNTVQDKYGVPYFCMKEECYSKNGFTISKINQKFADLLKENNIQYEQEYHINNYSYDFKVDNILIEINPTYTHNSTNPTWFHNSKKEPLDKNYHIEKTKLALENGYRCIHIWDWDNIDKIIEILKPKEKIYARKCIIKEVPIEESDLFLNKYHLQNTCKGQAIKLGLYYNNELVEIMTFGKPRYNKKYEYELLRLCTCSNYIVIGGTEKLFKYFINNYKPKSIISYCDNSKFDGEVYRRLGFTLKDFGSPSKHWFNGKRHITDNLLRQRGFDQLFNANYGKGTSNEELIINEGFVEVYDSGQSIYIKEF